MCEKNRKVKIREKLLKKKRSLIESLGRLGRFIREHKKKLGFLGLALAGSALVSMVGVLKTKHAIETGVKGVKEAVQSIVDASTAAIAAITALDANTIKRGVGNLTFLGGILWSLFSWVIRESVFYGVSGLVTAIIAGLYSYSVYAPSLENFDEVATELEVSSYTSVGQVPPDEVIEEVAVQKNLTVVEVKEVVVKKAKENPSPTFLDIVYSKGAGATAKTMKGSKKVVVGGIKTVENVVDNGGIIVYGIVGILVLILLIKLL